MGGFGKSTAHKPLGSAYFFRESQTSSVHPSGPVSLPSRFCSDPRLLKEPAYDEAALRAARERGGPHPCPERHPRVSGGILVTHRLEGKP